MRSDPAAELSDVASVAATSDGRIFVADGLAARITHLAPGGSILGTVGRRGGGPGEFDEPRTVQVLAADSLLVFDFARHRVTVFEPAELDVSHTAHLQVPPTATRPEWFARSRTGPMFVVAFTEYARADRPVAQGEDETTGSRLVRAFHGDGSLRRDSILSGPRGRRLVARQGPIIGSAGAHPFGPHSPISLGPDDRLYVGTAATDTVRILTYTLAGERLEEISLPCASPSVTRDQLERIVREYDDFFHDAIRETAPERWPALRGVVADDEGRLWLTVGGMPADSGTVWVVTHQGRIDLYLRIPPGARIEAVRDGRLYTVRSDELDVPRVEGWRLNGSPP